MAKRKAPARRRSGAAADRRSGAAAPRAAAARRRATARKSGAKKSAARKGGARKASARKVAPKAKKAVRPAAKRSAKKAVKRTAPKARASVRAKSVVRRVVKKAAAKTVAPKPIKTLVKKAAPPPKPKPRPKPKAVAVAAASGGKKKHALGLDRARLKVGDDDQIVSSTPPSSLNLDRSASSARSGRQELKERYDKHTETSPALTGGDVDADWESAYSTGDEAPGGDNPTPDQNNVDDIGLALGVEYEDNEELEGADKIEERDRHRWEDDPKSSEDYEDR